MYVLAHGRTAGDDVVCLVALAGFPVLCTEISEIRSIKPLLIEKK